MTDKPTDADWTLVWSDELDGDQVDPTRWDFDIVRHVKKHVQQPVTSCENYVPWQHKWCELVADVDFLSLHTYPVWEYKRTASPSK